MPTTIAFDFGTATIRAQLQEEQAPRLCRKVLEHLPTRSFAVHAKFAGEELIAMVPFYAEPENEILEVKRGDIGYYPGRQTFCIFYGKVVPFGKVSVFASVTDSLEVLRTLGAQALDKGILPLSIRLDDGGTAGVLSASVSARSTPSPGYLALIERFRQSVWAEAPADLARLKATSRPPMGNLPCMFYACFNLFWLGEELQVSRNLAVKQSVPLGSLKQTISELLLRHSGRLEKWEMQDTCTFLSALADVFAKQVSSYEEYVSAVEQALIAVDRIQSWVDATIPWSQLDGKLRGALFGEP
jgi:hypothetical protein